jgi:hypothetical protein
VLSGVYIDSIRPEWDPFNYFSNFKKMKNLFSILAGCALLSQPSYAGAQVSARGLAINQLFSTVVRSAVAGGDTAVSTPRPGAVNNELKVCCEKVVKDVQRIWYLNSRNGRMKLQIRGIYARGRALYFVLRLNNRSPLDYDVDSIRFFIAQKERGRRLPLRLSELSPVFVYDSAAQVKGYERVTSVIVLPRFTLPRRRRLLIEVLEKNGGRQLEVQASNFTLVNARLI